MSENLKLSAEQTQIVRNIQKGLKEFRELSIFAEPSEARAKHWGVSGQLQLLEETEPEIAKLAQAYFYEELPEEPQDLPGYGDALFNLLLDLRSFSEAKTLENVMYVYAHIHDDLSDFVSFSEEWDSERADWRENIDYSDY